MSIFPMTFHKLFFSVLVFTKSFSCSKKVHIHQTLSHIQNCSDTFNTTENTISTEQLTNKYTISHLTITHLEPYIKLTTKITSINTRFNNTIISFFDIYFFQTKQIHAPLAVVSLAQYFSVGIYHKTLLKRIVHGI